MMKTGGFAFILSVLRIKADLPYEVAPNYRVNRATDDQIEQIRPCMENLSAKLLFVSPYENDFQAVPGDKPDQVLFQPTPLPREHWRYYVVDFHGWNDQLEPVQQACLVIPNEIRLGFHFVQEDSRTLGYQWNAQSLHTFFNDNSDHYARVARVVSQDDLCLVSKTYRSLKTLPDDFEHISRAFKRFNELCNIPAYSELMVIGLFSIIESLLTHAPKLSESADSITHQIRSKITLVRKRFIRPLDHTEWFGSIGEDTLWSKLYTYRSRIVHGEHATLDGRLQMLKNRKTVVHFLREATKLLLIQSLWEPELMTDLKRC